MPSDYPQCPSRNQRMWVPPDQRWNANQNWNGWNQNAQWNNPNWQNSPGQGFWTPDGQWMWIPGGQFNQWNAYDRLNNNWNSNWNNNWNNNGSCNSWNNRNQWRGDCNQGPMGFNRNGAMADFMRYAPLAMMLAGGNRGGYFPGGCYPGGNFINPWQGLNIGLGRVNIGIGGFPGGFPGGFQGGFINGNPFNRYNRYNDFNRYGNFNGYGGGRVGLQVGNFRIRF